MIFLRQSTASQEVPLGRFVDSGDGDTEETGLTIANTDIKIWKHGATSLANKNSGGATHMANGEYYCVLDATDTDTVGSLKITIHVSGALYVQVFCHVLEEAVYDAFFAASAPGYVANAPVNVAQFGGVAATTSGGRPEVNASHISGDSVAADTLELFAEALDQTTGQIDNGTFAAGAIDAAAIANGAIDAATFAADVDAEILSYLVDDATRIDASALNTASTAVGSNGSGLTEAGGTGDHLTAVPWNAAWDAEVQSEVDAALVANNLDHLCKTATAAADMTTEVADNTIIARILANGDTSAFDPSTDGLQLIRDKETDIETDTQDIQSRLPAALTAGGNMKADALAISGDATAADTLELFAEALDQATGQLDNGSFQTNAFTGTMFATSFYDDIYAQVQAVLEEIPVTDFTAIPVSTPTYSQALGFLYALSLNRHTCTATTATIYDSDNNAVGTATVSDDGTTFTRTKYS